MEPGQKTLKLERGKEEYDDEFRVKKLDTLSQLKENEASSNNNGFLRDGQDHISGVNYQENEENFDFEEEVNNLNFEDVQTYQENTPTPDFTLRPERRISLFNKDSSQDRQSIQRPRDKDYSDIAKVSYIPKKMNNLMSTLEVEYNLEIENEVSNIELDANPPIKSLSDKEKELIVNKKGFQGLRDENQKIQNQRLKRAFKVASTIDLDKDSYSIIKTIELDTIQELANSHRLRKMPPRKILIFYNVVKKMNIFKSWHNPVIRENLQKIADYINKLDPQSVASFAILLNKTRYYEEK